MLFYYWASVVDGGPTFQQHLVIVFWVSTTVYRYTVSSTVFLLFCLFNMMHDENQYCWYMCAICRICVSALPAHTRHWINGGSMLARRLRRRPNIDPTLIQCLVLAGLCVSGCVVHVVTYDARRPAQPANTKRWPNVGLTLGQRCRQLANISPALGNVRCLLGSWTAHRWRKADYFDVLWYLVADVCGLYPWNESYFSSSTLYPVPAWHQSRLRSLLSLSLLSKWCRNLGITLH